MTKQNLTKKRKNNIVRYDKKKNQAEKKPIDVGTFVFIIIILYVIGHTGFFLFREKTSVYRVVSDEKSKVINTLGLAIRKEKVFKSTEAGYINYYVSGNSRVRKNEVIFSIDKTGNIYSKLMADDQNDESNKRMTGILHQFHINRDDNFFNTYSLKVSMNENVMTTSGKMVMATIKKTTEENNLFNVNYANDSGIIVYGTDGLEGMTEEKITSDIFEKQNSYILKTAAESEGKIEAGEAVYKLISEETWNVIVPITKEQKELLNDKNFVDAVIDNKGFTAKAKSRVEEINGSDYLILTFYNYMVDYADKRFVNIYIVLEKISGLKIPKSSVVERQVYEIPAEYYTGGGGNRSGGFTIYTLEKNNNIVVKYIETDICYKDMENNVVYIDTDEGFKSGDEIIDPKNQNVYKISKTKFLKGIYNINNGYPRFKHVEPDAENIKSDNSEYYLIPVDKGYYLNEYDNIILNADKMNKEKERIY
nr:HlyD family efflux transporter periplasmic adaptor subunit [uncultured Catonella sp.]